MMLCFIVSRKFTQDSTLQRQISYACLKLLELSSVETIPMGTKIYRSAGIQSISVILQSLAKLTDR